jgi:hypothetical protein
MVLPVATKKIPSNTIWNRYTTLPQAPHTEVAFVNVATFPTQNLCVSYRKVQISDTLKLASGTQKSKFTSERLREI